MSLTVPTHHSPPKAANLSTTESEAIKYGTSGSGIDPGPGSYDPFIDEISSINFNVTSIEGSFSKEERKPLNVSYSPGPVYNTTKPLGKGAPAASFGTSKRFSYPKESAGFHQKLSRVVRPGQHGSSWEGTFSRAERSSLYRANPSPGPAYNVSRSFLKGTRNRTMPKAERFPVLEDDESPGPVYMPKTSAVLRQATGTKFPGAQRFGNQYQTLGPGPITGSRDMNVDAVKAKSPAFSLKGRAKPEKPSTTLGPGAYNPNDDYRPPGGGGGKKPPAYSFAPPDPAQLAAMRAQKALAKAPKRDVDPMDGLHEPPKPKDTGVKDERTEAESTVAPSEIAIHLEGAEAAQERAGHVASGIHAPMKESAKEPRAKANARQEDHSSQNETPGPAHYMNIYKLFETQPNPKAYTIGGRRLHPDELEKARLPGPGAYPQAATYDTKYSKPASSTFGRAKRDTSLAAGKVDSPGPVYDNSKWPKKTPIRHGVATQTTNYTAKAESRRLAERETKEMESHRRHLAALGDALPCDDELYDYQPTRLDDVTTTRKDGFMVNVWY
uniref:Uncharacterized protein n=1 Tax=Eutreptiella gymnastica TaxID=73025 RepID=A0A7S1JGA6_9EUGL|mmetsp:Transcript_95319/g.164487  ORF Transcript_95319/g.164487 Transcript_95319/m.164487 type:complete len:554 (+) Transcript_95319:134-1795(+)